MYGACMFLKACMLVQKALYGGAVVCFFSQSQ